MNTTELKEKDLERVVGGMRDEDFQNLRVGARVQVIQGEFWYQCGTIYAFVDDVQKPGVHLVAIVRLDSGTVVKFGAEDIVRR